AGANDFTIGNATLHTAGMIAGKATRGQLVAMLGATHGDDIETIADLDRLDGIDAHQRLADIGVEAIEHRLAPARWYPGGLDIDTRADGITVLAQGVDVLFEFRHPPRFGAEKRIVVHRVQIV